MVQESELYRGRSNVPERSGRLSLLEASVSLDIAPAKKSQHVAILMATYNGARFIAEQLASIEHQEHSDWKLFVSDDGSTDGTPEILEETRQRLGESRFKWSVGPQCGFVVNFLSLVCSTDAKADFYAWSDQDDIWCADKLEVALKWLNSVPDSLPALYCGRSELVCESGLHVGVSPLFIRPPSFANSLVQNIGGGNTMVFNKAARELLLEAGMKTAVPSHDWWAYQLISGAGGIVHYDPQPKILYRQHGGNLVGSNVGWGSRLMRMRMVFEGRFKTWNDQTINALDLMQHRLTEEHKVTLKNFKQARNRALPFRALGCLRARIHRQTLLGNLGLVLAVILNRF